jgi:hypothetical protein
MISWKKKAWQFIHCWQYDAEYRSPGWRFFRVGIVKPIVPPFPGCYPKRGVNYRGFVISFRYFLPFERG